MAAEELVYEVDAGDRIRALDPAWGRFARENGVEDFESGALIGRSIFDFVDGGVVRHLYAQLFRAVRARGAPVRLPFRCDTPDRRRFMELCIEPASADGLVLTTQLLAEETRPAEALLDARAPRSGAFVAMCSWCKRVRTAPDRWEELEDAVRSLGLFDRSLPGLTHGICNRCEAEINAAVGAEDDPDAGDAPADLRAPGRIAHERKRS